MVEDGISGGKEVVQRQGREGCIAAFQSSSQVLLDSLWILDPASKPNNTRAGGNNFSLTSGQQEKICVTKS